PFSLLPPSTLGLAPPFDATSLTTLPPCSRRHISRSPGARRPSPGLLTCLQPNACPRVRLVFLAISNGSRQQSGPARADALRPVSISPFYFYSDSYEDVFMPITTKLKAVSLGVSLALAG